MIKTNAAHTARLGLLVAIGLIIFTLESLIPPLVPIPGIKLGLANVVTLFALCAFSRKDACVVLLLRIVLASIFAGQAVSFWYSICGGLLCLFTMSILKGLFDEKYMEFTSVAGGVAHNIGQLLAAVVIAENIKIIYLAPVLMLGGAVCGFFTGILCKMTYNRIKKIMKL